MVKEHEPEFPAASVMTYFTLFVPIPISLGRLVSTFLSFIVKTTENESTVIPGSSAIKELSVQLTFQLTVATLFPGSLFTSKSVGQLLPNEGGWKSEKEGEMLILQCNFNGVTRIFQRGGGGRGSHKVNHRVLIKLLSQPPRYVLLNVKKKS